jgi:hypothetical protein
MISKTVGTFVAAALLAGYAQLAAAQAAPRNSVVCTFPWCYNSVIVVPASTGAPAPRMEWEQIRMQKKLASGTIMWELLGSPDYEFRADSVAPTGATAANASAQFPVRLISPTQIALDNLNNNDTTYTYDLKVYRKGSTAPPIVTNGSIVNSFN